MPSVKMTDGVEIYYEELGSGDRYLFCSQVDHSIYSLERETAKRGFHVILITNRGFGRSTHVTEDYGEHWYDRFADDVIGVANALNIDKFVYSGASHGAGTGWHLVLKYPERIICFFAVVPGPHNLDEGRESMRAMQLAGKISPPVFRAATDDKAILERRRLEDQNVEKRRTMSDYKAVYEAEETKAIDYGRPLCSLKNEKSLQAALRSIRVPVLIIGGMEDTISRPDLMLRSAQCLSECKLVIYSGVGHALDIWEEAAEEAFRFYNNIRKTGHCYEAVIND